MDARKYIAVARTTLLLTQPFFGTLALRLVPIEVMNHPKIKTAATDGVSLFYNPDWILSLSPDERVGVVCHEVMHCAMQHHTRRGLREPERWNEACDYSINGLIEDAGFTLPPGKLRSPAYDGKSVEAVYNLLPPSQPKRPGGQGGQGDEGGMGNEGSRGQDQGQNQGQDGSPGTNQGDQNNQNGDPGGCGGVLDAPNPNGPGPASPADMEQISQEWNQAVVQAAQIAKGQGKLPVGLERLLDGILNPKVPWQDYLRAFVQKNAKNDYRWFPPNRRFIHMGLYLPSLRSEELGEVVWGIDTSDSIGQKEINQFGGELNSVLEEFHPTCHAVYCDAAVQGVETFEWEDLPLTSNMLHPKGGGGTSFLPVFQEVETQGWEPSCLIYLTDGMGTFPKKEDEPPYPVLWVVTRPTKVPFGEVIDISL